MQLREFVKATIFQVTKGVQDAQAACRDSGAVIAPSVFRNGNNVALQLVEFDVAIAASEAASEKAGPGLLVAGLGVGARSEANETASTLNRIKFSVPVYLPGDSKT